MIAKTSTGPSFGGALDYGAGIKQGKVHKPAELLGASNLVARDSQGMAAEMSAVADGSRCQRPVWHTSLNWPKGETVEKRQLLKAAAEYCRRMGADPTRHQIAIYQHHDRPHTHIHIYINRVPLDGGPALDTSHNYARNVAICQAITQQLGMRPLPDQRQSLQDHHAQKQTTRQYVQEALKMALAQTEVATPEQLGERLQQQGIESQFKYSSQQVLVGCSFRYGEVAVKGTEVGYKAKQIDNGLQHNRQEQAQSQTAWDALFAGYTTAKEQDQWQELQKGYQQAKAQEKQVESTPTQKVPTIEQKQAKTPSLKPRP